MTRLRVLLQVGLFAGVFLVARRITRALGLPVAPGVVGLLILLGGLRLGVLRPEWVEAGGDLLLRHLPLFLVPIAVGLIAWAGPLHREWPWLVAVLAVSTGLAAAAAGMLAARLAERRRAEKPARAKPRGAGGPRRAREAAS
jgi:holin-like protein